MGSSTHKRNRQGGRPFKLGASLPFAALAVLLLGCGDEPMQPRGMALAVDSVIPRASEAGQTVELRIRGTGFRSGTEARIERGGATDPAIVAGGTSFVSETELLTTVQIGEDAALALYDVVVANPDGTWASAGGIFTVEESVPIIVEATEPSEAGRTETVQVRILGSGFQEGDKVAWELDDMVDDHVVVGETVFVSAQELVVTISVQADARIGGRNVAVSRPRKRGIGTEAFTVLPGDGSELEAMFRFTYDGYRSDSFQVDHTFVLMPGAMDPGSWGVTHYTHEYGEQFLGAHHLRGDGLLDMMWCWSPGGRVREPSTRSLECWFTPQYNWETGEYADPEDYTSFVGGGRPGDGTGTVTFTSVTPERLAGTFSITMHVVDWEDWYQSPSIEIRDGTFDLPVVSSYWDRSDPGEPDPGTFSGSSTAAINDDGVVIGTAVGQDGKRRAVRWTVGPDGSVTGPVELGALNDWPTHLPTAINRHGVIIGLASPDVYAHSGFIYDGTIQALTTLDGAAVTRAYGINDLGMVVGDANMTGDFTDLRGLLWRNPLDPGELPIQLPDWPAERPGSNPRFINNHGAIAGWSSGKNVRWQIDEDGTVSEPELIELQHMAGMNDLHDFAGTLNDEPVIIRGGIPIALGPLRGGEITIPRGLNSPLSGAPVQVVGTRVEGSEMWGSPRTTAMVWSVDAAGLVTGPAELGRPSGYDFVWGPKVNAHGWIVGTAHNGATQDGVATLWRPIGGGSRYEIILLGGLAPVSVEAAAKAAPTRCRVRPLHGELCPPPRRDNR
jgi:hypothetical protein